MGQLIGYNAKKGSPIKDPKELMEMCFRAAFVTSFLVDGVGFPKDYEVTAMDVINGQKVGWALGSMLYEINTLPWEFAKHSASDVLKEQSKKCRSSSFMLFDAAARLRGSKGDFEFVAGLLLFAVMCIGLMSGFKHFLFHRRSWRIGQHLSSRLKSSEGHALAESMSSGKNHPDYGSRSLP
jgi:GDA1/CD39 (nucleoside phosphatase) family